MAQPLKSELAKVDLLEIWCYIAEDSPTNADRQVRRIDDALDLIERAPGIGTSRDDLYQGLRTLAVDKYLVCFRRIKDEVHILRVIHGARDLEKLFEGS